MPAPSELRLGTAEEMVGAVTRSHLPDGRVVGWYGGPGVVLDAELSDVLPPPRLAARFGTEDFWARWTAAECAAKLADVPMHLWLRRHGLTHPGAEVRHVVGEGLLICLARAVTEPT